MSLARGPARLLLGALLLMLALPTAPAGAARLTGTVDHSFMGARETVNFVLALAGGTGGEPPDLSLLAKDFDIVDRTRHSRFEEVDGRRVEVNEWVMILAPKRTGVLTIPSLTVEGMSSAPIKVEVVPAAATEAPAPADPSLFVRVDVGDAAPYAQSLIPVVVRIFDAVGIRGGQLGVLTADGAILSPEGPQRVYPRTVGGKQYIINEQSFLMQPQKSGRLEIAPVAVEATVPIRPSAGASSLPNLLGRDPVSPFDLKDVTLRSRPVAVEVKPRPAAVEGWFLPARGVTLSDSWSAKPAAAKVGVALSRTIRLKARGASPNQLPVLPVAEVEGLRQYEDASRSERVTIDGAAGAELVKTVSIVPTRAGRITLPAVAVDWWNTDRNRPERTELPAVTLDVAPAADAASADAPAARVTASGAGASSAAQQIEAPTLPALVPEDLKESLGIILALLRGPLLWAVGAAVALVLAAGLLWRRRAARRMTRSPAMASSAARNIASPPARPASGRTRARAAVYADAEAAERALVRACRTGDAPGAHEALGAWLRLSPGTGTGTFHTPKMAGAVHDLGRTLYSAEAAPWNGRELLAALKAEKDARRRLSRRARRARIAPLYPTAG